MSKMSRSLSAVTGAMLAILGLSREASDSPNHISRNGKASYGPGRARRNRVSHKGRGGKGNTRAKIGAFEAECILIQQSNAEANAKLPSYRKRTTNIKKIRHAYRKELNKEAA